MQTLSRDTSPAAEQVQLALFRAMSAYRKVELVSELRATARTLALAGLRRRYPAASEAELEWHWRTLTLGEDLTQRAFGRPEESP